MNKEAEFLSKCCYCPTARRICLAELQFPHCVTDAMTNKVNLSYEAYHHSYHSQRRSTFLFSCFLSSKSREQIKQLKLTEKNLKKATNSSA